MKLHSALGWLALGAGAYLAFAIALLPAATAYRWLAPHEVRLAGIQGTVWSGRAALGSVGGLPLREPRWRIHPLALLAGRISARFDARLADGFVQGAAQAGFRTVRFTELQGSASLAALRDVLPLADTTGLASADLSRLDLQHGWPVAAAGRLRVAELHVAPLFPAGGPLIPLGAYELTFIDNGAPGLHAELRDMGGPLEVSGRLELRADRSYRLEGTTRARPEAAPELLQGLELMTDDPDAEGRRAFSFTGSL